eukprot:SAG31_NODE_591_length_13740_cov_11.032256_1_plen_66_part_00
MARVGKSRWVGGWPQGEELVIWHDKECHEDGGMLGSVYEYIGHKLFSTKCMDILNSDMSELIGHV